MEKCALCNGVDGRHNMVEDLSVHPLLFKSKKLCPVEEIEISLNGKSSVIDWEKVWGEHDYIAFAAELKLTQKEVIQHLVEKHLRGNK